MEWNGTNYNKTRLCKARYNTIGQNQIACLKMTSNKNNGRNVKSNQIITNEVKSDQNKIK
jgi:hypothetical protein